MAHTQASSRRSHGRCSTTGASISRAREYCSAVPERGPTEGSSRYAATPTPTPRPTTPAARSRRGRSSAGGLALAWGLGGVHALEDLARGAGRVQAAGDDLVEELAEALVLRQRRLEARAQAERADPEDLVAQVAPAALGERALRLDVGAVLVELLHQL